MQEESERRRARFSPLTRGLIAVGTGCVVLAIPLVTTTAASAATAPARHSTTTTVLRTAAHKSDAATYTVVPGDSLSGIAASHSLSGGWHKLYQDNRQAVGGNPSLIHPGLELTLGGVSHAPAGKGKATPTTVTGTPSGTRSGVSATPATLHGAAGATVAVQAAAKTYSNDLNGWINQSLDVMAAHGIPGSYDGIYRNIMRESSGNPQAINNWDSNAAAGTPSKGLLQVIAPTFATYHVSGTSMDIYDPVANITAACNYAAATYGSIDNVNGPY